MPTTFIKKFIIFFILIAVIAGLAFYFYGRLNNNSQPAKNSEEQPSPTPIREALYKDGSFEVLKPIGWNDIDPGNVPMAFFNKIREDLKINIEKLGGVSNRYKCLLLISKSGADGDFIKKATLYKDRILAGANYKLLSEDGLRPESSFVFLKILDEEAAVRLETRIYSIADEMYFLTVSGPLEDLARGCQAFSDSIPSLIKTGNNQ